MPLRPNGALVRRRPNLVVFRLAWAGLRSRGGRWLLLALGFALAAALPVVAAGLHREASVAAVQQAVDTLPASEQAVLAVTSRRLPAAELVAVDRSVRDGFGAAGLRQLRSLVVFRPLALRGVDVTVGGIDGFDVSVRLTAGHRPHSCHPRACEVLAVTPQGSTSPPDLPALARAGRELGLRVVGAGQLQDARLVGLGLAAKGLPLLLGADPAAMGDLEALALFGRNTAWYASVDGSTVAARTATGFTRSLTELADAVNAASGPISVSWPADRVAAAGARADASAGRFAAWGAGAAALQLGFCLVAAAGLRSSQQATGELLRRRGASNRQVWSVTAAQATIAVVAGLVLGVVAGTGVVGLRSAGLTTHPWSLAVAAAASVLLTTVGLAVAAVVLAVAVIRWPPGLARSTQLVADVALLAVVGAVVLVWRGSSGIGGANPLAPSLVVLVEVATGLVAARLWVPAVVLLARRPPFGAVGRVALWSGRRRPLLATVTTGFVAAACCALVFAANYWDTLVQSASDQAAEQVPLDVVVGPSATVPVPAEVVDDDRLSRLVPAATVHPVVSSTVTVFAGTTAATALPLTGVDPDVLPAVHEFAAVTGSAVPAAELAARLRGPEGSVAGPMLPGTGRLRLRVAGLTPDITVSLWVSTRSGRDRHLALRGTGSQLTAKLGGAGPVTVRALEIAESASHLVHRQHAVGEGGTDRALATGALRLGPATLDGRPVPWPWTSWGSEQATVTSRSSTRLGVRYQVGDARVVLTPQFVPRNRLPALAVAADPLTAERAGPTGALGVTVNGLTLPAQVVAVLPRVPTLGQRFLLAERAAVAARVDRTAPGTAPVSQVWITAPGDSVEAVRAVLDTPPAVAASRTYRRDVERSIRLDPVATRSTALLGITAGLALLLALVGIVVAVRADLRESADESFALELDGWPTSRLRSALLLRWLSTLVVALPLGVAGGYVLAAAAVELLTTGPTGEPVEPPLRMLIATPATLAAVGAAVLGGIVTGLAATATGYREATPVPPEVDLR